MYSRKWESTYPTVPTTKLAESRWSIAAVGPVRVERGTLKWLRAIDVDWAGLPHASGDGSDCWQFTELGKRPPERFLAVGADDRVVAVWIDHNDLVCGNAYRLDYLKVRPDLHSRGLGKIALGLVALRARELNARRVVFQPVERAEPFFRSHAIGAQNCSDWKGALPLPNLQLEDAALQHLENHVASFRIPN